MSIMFNYYKLVWCTYLLLKQSKNFKGRRVIRGRITDATSTGVQLGIEAKQGQADLH